MKKTSLILLCTLSIYANDAINKALEYEKQGEYQKAMQIYKELALKNAKNNSTEEQPQEQAKHSLHTQEHNMSKIDPKSIALANYLDDKDDDGNFFGISPHNLSYFMPVSYNFNKQNTEVKFQVSLKKTLFENLLGLNETYNIAYTQISWWQLYEHSAPFRESNYLPEFFINFPISTHGYFENLKNIRIGILHESNGQDDPKSRSWNRIYLSNMYTFDNFILVPRIWLRLPESDDDNPDIEKYLGNFDINLAYSADDYFFNVLWRNNLDFSNNRGAVELSFAYKISNNGLYLYTQYFNGYGESLIEYNKSSSKLSGGILLMY